MAYKRTNWVNGETPINAENLNNIEDGIGELASDLSNLENTVLTTKEVFENVDLETTSDYSVEIHSGYNANVGSGLIKLTKLETYDTYCFLASEDMVVAVNSDNYTYYALCTLLDASGEWVESITSGQLQMTGGASTRYRKSESNLPTISEPLTITQGTAVTITVPTGETPNLLVYKTLKVLAETKKAKVKYELANTVEASTEQLSIYIPTFVGYIKYQFVHTVNTDKNADNWRLGIPYAVDDDLNERFPLSPGGEWECAVRLVDRDDFSGGYAHGDEIGTDLFVIVDGVEKTVSSIAELIEFEELKVITNSNLYDPADHTTIIATHGCERIFKAGKCVVNQLVNWKVAESVTTCYLAMFPPYKTYNDVSITDTFYTDMGFIKTATPTSGKATVNNAKSATIYSDDSGFMATFSITEYPEGYTGDKYFMVNDNSGQNYNKLYYRICSEGSVAIDEVWKSQTIYELHMGK